MTVVGVVSLRLSYSFRMPLFSAMKMRPSDAKRIAVGNVRLLMTTESWNPLGSEAAAGEAPAVAEAPGVRRPGAPGGVPAPAADASRTTRAPTSAPGITPRAMNRRTLAPLVPVLRCRRLGARVQVRTVRG